MRSPFVCDECWEVVSQPWNRIAVRIEYRNESDDSRYHVKTVGHLCRACVDAMFATPNHPGLFKEVV